MKKLIIEGIAVTIIALPIFNYVNQDPNPYEDIECPAEKLPAEDGSCVNADFWDNDTYRQAQTKGEL